MVFPEAAAIFSDYPDPTPVPAYLGGEHGIRQLETALAAPQQGTAAGSYFHRTVFDKAAALFRSLIVNHPLEDGNKRLALTACFVFLLANGYPFYRPRAETVQFALCVATESRAVSLKSIADWFRNGSLNLRRLERLQRHGQADEARQLVTRYLHENRGRLEDLLAFLAR